jgi:hypothetical protein
MGRNNGLAKMIVEDSSAVEIISSMLDSLEHYGISEYDRVAKSRREALERGLVALAVGLIICEDCDELETEEGQDRCLGCYSSELDPNSEDYLNKD